MSPFLITQSLEQWPSYLVYLLIGIAFGFVLEIAGFADARKLAAQFYFREQTVLKVMFSAIVVAMLLIFAAAGLGWLDYNLIWVNPTYLWPGILGGLIMGFGFIIGGFCPGTSLVAAATLKLDGLFFVLGAFFGIFLFGETVSFYESFWESSYLGRYTLPEWLGLDTGVVVLLIVIMAILMFVGAEWAERVVGGRTTSRKQRRRQMGLAGTAVFAGLAVLLIGQPTTADRWEAVAHEKLPLLTNRQVQIHPGELLDLLHNPELKPILLDVRSESDYNRFHIRDARHVPLAELSTIVADLHFEPAQAVFVVMSNDEQLAAEAWQLLVAESVPNVYILSGGLNNWLATFGGSELTPDPLADPGQLRYQFSAALGGRHPAATPNPEAFQLLYTPKVELKLKQGPAVGGCG